MIYVELFNNSSNPLMYNSAKTVPKYPFKTIKLNNIYHIIDFVYTVLCFGMWIAAQFRIRWKMSLCQQIYHS